jgi:hypothetical protein
LIKLVVQFDYGTKLERIFDNYEEAKAYGEQFKSEPKQFIILNGQKTWEDVAIHANETLNKHFTSLNEINYI